MDDWDRMVDVNIKGILYGIAAVLPHMTRQNAGHIINVASVAGLKVPADGSVYSATKHAVRALSEGLRQEVKGQGLRTTIIFPGAVATELVDGITDPEVAAGMRAFYQSAISADTFARAVVYVIEKPNDVDINEVVIRPTSQAFCNPSPFYRISYASSNFNPPR